MNWQTSSTKLGPKDKPNIQQWAIHMLTSFEFTQITYLIYIQYQFWEFLISNCISQKASNFQLSAYIDHLKQYNAADFSKV